MIKSINYFSMLFIALFTFSCTGQSRTEALNSKDSEKLTRKEIQSYQYGAGDVVTKGYLDQSGNMWFTTTKEGIFKYDGKSFINFAVEDGLCGNEVWAILEDQNGMMWFGTANGLCKFDGKIFENLPIPKEDTKSDWLDSAYPIVNPSGVTSIIQDRNGVFWIGSNGAGVYRYDGNEFTSYLKNKGNLMPNSLHHNVILSILEDKLGNIWFSSFSHGGVSKFDGNTFAHYGINDGLGDDMIASSYMDKSGKLWFGTRGGGMSYFNGKTFSTIHEVEGRCSNNMATLLEDRKGNLWVASYARNGVCWYGGDSFIPFEVEGSDQLIDIKCIAEDKEGNIWFGGRYGILWRYDGNELKNFTYVKRNNKVDD